MPVKLWEINTTELCGAMQDNDVIIGADKPWRMFQANKCGEGEGRAESIIWTHKNKKDFCAWEV